MKKKISLFLILFVLAFVLVGCRKPHKHNYVSNKFEATCTEKGYTEHTCECGESYIDSYVDASGHSFGEWVVVKEATEEEKGLRERECSCGEKETEEIQQLEHVHSYTETVVNPTCKEQGYTLHSCACGESFKDNYKETIPHTFGEWVVVKEATEEAEGLKERECSCGEKESEAIEKLPHTHKYGEWVVVKEATEEAEGLKERECSCGEKESEVIEKLPHTHKYGEWVVVKEATEESEGLKERECSCGEKESEVIEKVLHTHKYGEWVVVKEATEEADGLKERECSCGEKETEVLPKIEHVHAWSEWKVLTEATLESEGLKERECSCGEKQTQVIAKLQGEVVEPKYVYVGAGKEYTELDAAIAAVEDGTIIVLSAGEYSLSAIIDKNITIQGPNANLYAYDYHTNEAIINVAKDVAGNLKAANITFNGVHLVGTGGGAGIPGVFFQDGGGLENLTFKSCVVSDMNTFIKINGGTSSVNLLIEDCYIHTIGQFIVWAQSAQIKETILINNYVDGSTCGAVTNAAAALFRIRTGKLEAYANYFNGNSANTPGYFECSNLDSIIKYNTFNNVTSFVHSGASNKVVFDQNLYLNNGKALEKAPSTVAVGGAVADKVVAKSDEEVEELYLESLLNKQPIRYFRVEFDANGGTITSSYPAIYDLTVGIETLPTVELEGLIFAGWYLNGEKVESIPAGTEGDIKLVAKWSKDTLLVDGVGENGHYATLADALAAAKEGDIIELVAGEYTENVTINKANITIIGPNYGINGNSSSRAAEAIFKGVITITSAGKCFEIDGLAFTGGAKIKYDESVAYEGFTFQNNKVYDTTETSVAFTLDRYATPGFIQFTLASGGSVKNIMIFNNSFENVSEVNLLINRAINLSVEGNTFKNFDLDAIRVEGGYAYGILAFTNNRFEQTTKEHGHNGIFIYSVAGGTGTTAKVLIENNTFINVGSNNGTTFGGAISGYRYQENPTTFEIRNNIFDHCYDYLYIRNNGANNSTWSCVVENNQFLGLPHNHYYGSYVGTDTESSNPHTAVFGANYYEDNDGNVISDLSAYASYFKHMASYGTALSAKPGEEEADVYEFWNITYDLNDGATKDSLVYSYVTPMGEEIVLPTLTKTNYQFNGWLLDGELITAIPVGTRGDLHLIADFTVLEGEIYEIEFVNQKETAIWPSRPADSREEIVEELMKDLYEWAQGNGETRSYEAYKEYIKGQIAGYSDIKLRNKDLGNYPAEDGSTEYFLNVPKYYQKWNEFFAIFNEAMIKVNADQVFYKDNYAAMVRLHQFIAWTSTGQGYFNSFLTRMCAATKVPAEIPTTYRGGQVVELPQLSMANGLKFLGWYDNPEFTGDVITTIMLNGMQKY